MTITALKLLKAAAARGWSFEVDGGEFDEPDYVGNKPQAAWRAVTEQDQACVVFRDAAGKRLGVALLMAPGDITCSPEETLVNFTEGGEFSALCEALIEEVL